MAMRRSKVSPEGQLGLEPTGDDMVRVRLNQAKFRVRLQWLSLERGHKLGLESPRGGE